MKRAWTESLSALLGPPAPRRRCSKKPPAGRRRSQETSTALALQAPSPAPARRTPGPPAPGGHLIRTTLLPLSKRCIDCQRTSPPAASLARQRLQPGIFRHLASACQDPKSRRCRFPPLDFPKKSHIVGGMFTNEHTPATFWHRLAGVRPVLAGGRRRLAGLWPASASIGRRWPVLRHGLPISRQHLADPPRSSAGLPPTPAGSRPGLAGTGNSWPASDQLLPVVRQDRPKPGNGGYTGASPFGLRALISMICRHLHCNAREGKTRGTRRWSRAPKGGPT